MGSHLYKIRPSGTEWPESFPTGSFLKEEKLLDALEEIAEKRGLPGDLMVHVYETDATRLGIGRKHLGTIRASSVLTAEEVDMNRVRS